MLSVKRKEQCCLDFSSTNGYVKYLQTVNDIKCFLQLGTLNAINKTAKPELEMIVLKRLACFEDAISRVCQELDFSSLIDYLNIFHMEIMPFIKDDSNGCPSERTFDIARIVINRLYEILDIDINS